VNPFQFLLKTHSSKKTRSLKPIQTLKRSITHLLKGQNGQGLIEYLIIVAIVAVGTLSIMRIVGQSVNVKFARIAEALGARSEGRLGDPSINETSWRKKDMTNFFQNAR
jgi:Flp pilus assembly pilin Flp